MKNSRILLSLLFCSTLLLAATANGAELAKANPSQPAVEQAIPVQILGKTIEIRKGMTRADAKKALSPIIKEEASLDTAERLQYDIPLVPNSAPVSIVFDFDRKGTVHGFMLDSMRKDQNPAAATLVNWLQANAGKPQGKKKGSATWTFGGWKIEHTVGGSGEASAYRIEFTPSK